MEIEPMKPAEATKDAASATSATGAVTSETRPPPALGPAAHATTRLDSNFALASSSCWGATTDGRYAPEAISKRTASEPFTTAVPYRCGRVKMPSPYATGTEQS